MVPPNTPDIDTKPCMYCFFHAAVRPRRNSAATGPPSENESSATFRFFCADSASTRAASRSKNCQMTVPWQGDMTRCEVSTCAASRSKKPPPEPAPAEVFPRSQFAGPTRQSYLQPGASAAGAAAGAAAARAAAPRALAAAAVEAGAGASAAGASGAAGRTWRRAGHPPSHSPYSRGSCTRSKRRRPRWGR